MSRALPLNPHRGPIWAGLDPTCGFLRLALDVSPSKQFLKVGSPVKNLKSIHWNPCTGGLKIPHTPIGTWRNAKNENFEFYFDCGKNVFQWTKKSHLGHFDWNCSCSRYPLWPNTQNMAILAENRCLRLKVMLRDPKLWVSLILNVIGVRWGSLEHILTIIDTYQNFHFLVFL